MKKVLVVLALAAMMYGTASAGIVNTASFGDLVTRSAIYDTANGDANTWQSGNNRSGKGAGGSGYAANWGLYNGAWPGSDEALIGIDRAELQAQVTAKGPNFDAYYIVPLRAGVTATPDMVVGIFKMDNDSTVMWTGNPTTNRPRATNVDTAGTKWTSNSVQYNEFELMVKGTGQFQTSVPYTVSNKNLGTTGSPLLNQTMVLHIGPALINAYLTDTSFDGFFLGNAGAGSVVRGYGGDQWTQGVGCQSIQIVAVPEPATMVLLALGGLALLRRRA